MCDIGNITLANHPHRSALVAGLAGRKRYSRVFMGIISCITHAIFPVLGASQNSKFSKLRQESLLDNTYEYKQLRAVGEVS